MASTDDIDKEDISDYFPSTTQLTRNNLDDLIARQTKIFIEDAANHRSIFHKLDFNSLRLYEVLNSTWFRILFRIAVFTLLLLPIIEWPSSLTVTSDPRLTTTRPRAPCGVTEFIEGLCLLVVIIETFLLIRIFGLIWLRNNPWILLRLLLITMYILDLTVSLCLHCTDFYRIRRFIRPYFLISSSQLMKKLLKCLKRTLPKLFSTLFLLLLWLVCATLVALCIFAEVPSEVIDQTSPNSSLSAAFPDFYTSMFRLLVLLTTANHPDVVLKPYARNRAAAIFPIIFLSIGLYVFMNILTAIVYSEFHGYLKSSVQTRLIRRRLATRAAFELLRLVDRESDEISRDRLNELIQTIRVSSWKRRALQTAYTIRFAESNLKAADFMELFQTLDLSSPPLQESCLRAVGRGFPRTFQRWITSSYFAKLSIAVSVLNLINMAIDLADGFTSKLSFSVEMRIINWSFVAFYLFEEFSFMWALGTKAFFKKWSNAFSLATVLLLLVVKIIELCIFIADRRGVDYGILNLSIVDVVRLANLLLLTRTVRIVHLFTWTKLVAGVLADLPKNLAPVMGIFISIYYTYALLGMSLFHGAIRIPGNSSNILQFECGTYQQLEYWPINFDDFLASLVLLWDLMVVNNWFVIVQAYQEAVSLWVHVYMISWWLIAVVGLLSLVTALVIESFVYRRDQYMRPLSVESSSKEVTVVRQGFPDSVQITSIDAEQQGAVGLSTPVVLTFTRSSEVNPESSEMVTRPYQRIGEGTSISFDALFNADLREPTEDELLAQINEHPSIREIKQLVRRMQNDISEQS